MFDKSNDSYQYILSDMQKCLEKQRVDEQMSYFMYIYSQLSDDVKDDNINSVYERVKSKYIDWEFRQQLEFFYALSLGEEGRLLFDPSIDYNPKYDMDNFIDLYKEISELKMSIANCLGIIKGKMMNIVKKDMLSGFME